MTDSALTFCQKKIARLLEFFARFPAVLDERGNSNQTLRRKLKEIEHETHIDKYLDGSGYRWTIRSSPFRAG
jgi:hypothetical protein